MWNDVFICGAVSGFFSLAALAAVCFLREPEWAGRLPYSWRKINVLAAIVAVSSMLVALLPALTQKNAPVIEAASATASTLCLGWCFTQACFTDLHLHLVDRRCLTTANIICFPLGLAATHVEGGGLDVFFIVAAMVAAALVFLPTGIGASDGRAFLLVVASAVPNLGMDGVRSGFLLMFVLLLVVGLVLKIVDARCVSGGWRGMVSRKVMVPAVPFILLPFWVLLLHNFLQMLVK